MHAWRNKKAALCGRSEPLSLAGPPMIDHCVCGRPGRVLARRERILDSGRPIEWSRPTVIRPTCPPVEQRARPIVRLSDGPTVRSTGPRRLALIGLPRAVRARPRRSRERIRRDQALALCCAGAPPSPLPVRALSGQSELLLLVPTLFLASEQPFWARTRGGAQLIQRRARFGSSFGLILVRR